MKDWRTPVFFVLAVLCCCLVSYFAGRVKGRRIGYEAGYAAGYEAGWTAPRQSDTLVVRDTLLVERPVPVYQYIEKPVYLPVTDTMLVSIHDTTFVALERTRKGYAGEDWECEVSGIDPALVWMRVYPKTIYVTSETPGRVLGRWGLGVTAGPSVLWDGQLRAGVGASVGLTLRF